MRVSTTSRTTPSPASTRSHASARPSRSDDEAAFATALTTLHDGVRSAGTARAPDSLDESDVILPPSGASIDEVRELLSDEADPGLNIDPMAHSRFINDTGLTVRMTTVMFLLGAAFVALIVVLMYAFPQWALIIGLAGIGIAFYQW